MIEKVFSKNKYASAMLNNEHLEKHRVLGKFCPVHAEPIYRVWKPQGFHDPITPPRMTESAIVESCFSCSFEHEILAPMRLNIDRCTDRSGSIEPTDSFFITVYRRVIGTMRSLIG